MRLGIKSCLYAMPGAILLYIIETISSFFLFINIHIELFQSLFIISIICGVSVVVCAVFYKNVLTRWIALRFFVFWFLYCFIFIVNGYIGTINLLYNIFGVNSSSSNDNASGLLTLTYLTIVFIISVFVTIIKAKQTERKHTTQGDG